MKEITCNGKKITFDRPRLMGILNLTPDSFYESSRFLHINDIIKRIDKMIEEGADIIDIGAVSTRPGAKEVSEKDEIARLMPIIREIRKTFPHSILSVDTYRAGVAQRCLDSGVDIINDISGGTMDPKMLPLIASKKAPYILMHIQGTPQTMQNDPKYKNVVKEVFRFLEKRAGELSGMGCENIIIDPGFGFGKALDHNYSLLKHLAEFKSLNYPILVGLSRKSFINKVLGTKPDNALNGTTVLNTIALMNGADILRVHDVKQAAEVIALCSYYMESS